MTDDYPQPEDLLPAGFAAGLLALLRDAVPGMDEYSLIRRLAQVFPDSVFAIPGVLRDPLTLFQVHFLLFHQLYRLSDTLLEEGLQIRINALSIGLEPRLPGKAGLQLNDPLRVYYLDWSQWLATNADDVERLLGDFFRGRGSVPAQSHQAALEHFSLREPVSLPQIKRRYRQLLSEHHPDRGGDTATAQAINESFLILQRYYGKL